MATPLPHLHLTRATQVLATEVSAPVSLSALCSLAQDLLLDTSLTGPFVYHDTKGDQTLFSDEETYFEILREASETVIHIEIVSECPDNPAWRLNIPRIEGEKFLLHQDPAMSREDDNTWTCHLCSQPFAISLSQCPHCGALSWPHWQRFRSQISFEMSLPENAEFVAERMVSCKLDSPIDDMWECKFCRILNSLEKSVCVACYRTNFALKMKEVATDGFTENEVLQHSHVNETERPREDREAKDVSGNDEEKDLPEDLQPIEAVESERESDISVKMMETEEELAVETLDTNERQEIELPLTQEELVPDAPEIVESHEFDAPPVQEADPEATWQCQNCASRNPVSHHECVTCLTSPLISGPESLQALYRSSIPSLRTQPPPSHHEKNSSFGSWRPDPTVLKSAIQCRFCSNTAESGSRYCERCSNMLTSRASADIEKHHERSFHNKAVTCPISREEEEVQRDQWECPKCGHGFNNYWNFICAKCFSTNYKLTSRSSRPGLLSFSHSAAALISDKALISTPKRFLPLWICRFCRANNYLSYPPLCRECRRSKQALGSETPPVKREVPQEQSWLCRWCWTRNLKVRLTCYNCSREKGKITAQMLRSPASLHGRKLNSFYSSAATSNEASPLITHKLSKVTFSALSFNYQNNGFTKAASCRDIRTRAIPNRH